MRTVALISGGKDSCYNIMCCIAEGHEIVALANLRPENKDEIDSYMFQTVGHMAVDLYAEAMDLQLFSGIIKGSSVCTGRSYEPNADDEVEDLFQLLQTIKEEKRVQAVSVGAILSDYQRIRVENVCERLGLTVLAFLWRRNQKELLQEMIECGIKAKIIKVAAMGLNPQEHLGLDLEEIYPHLIQMHSEYGLNICGEGGEYETFVYDCPLFKREIVINQTELVIHSDDAFAQVGYLNLLDCQHKDKEWDNTTSLREKILKLPIFTSEKWIRQNVPHDDAEITQDGAGDSGLSGMVMCVPELHTTDYAPTVYTDGAHFVVSGVKAFLSEGVDISGAIMGALSVLQNCLNGKELKASDIVSMSLVVGDMSQFAEINKIYKTFFSTNPPVRLCIQANLPRNIALQLDCQGKIQQQKEEDKLVMHVQSLSHWAPANIGPYSQAVLTGDKLYLAGIIPLVPATLEVIKGGITSQCLVALLHVKNVMLAIKSNCTLWSCPLVMCYLTKHEHVNQAEGEWKRALESSVESIEKPKLTPRVQFCIVPALPKGSLVEWHMYAWPNLNSEDEVTGINVLQQFEKYTITSCAVHHKGSCDLFSCHITVDLGSLKDYSHIDTMQVVKELLVEYHKVLEKGGISFMTPLVKILFSPTVFNYGILHKCFQMNLENVKTSCNSHPLMLSLVPVDGLATQQQVLAWCQ
ncbi:Diphthine--ammonia ligase [Bulinus truncatus]|nr:Diphthine--ammonia ligase [Bulinus truncatus]